MSQLSQDEAIRGCGPGGLLLTFLEQGQLLRRNRFSSASAVRL
jgi:hypothetical protein